MQSISQANTHANQSEDRRSAPERRSARGGLRLSPRARLRRRKHGRRRQDIELGFYTDYYDSGLLMMALGVMGLSVLDAVFSLRLIANGAQELNPIMAFLIEHNVLVFAWAKIAITAIVLVLLVSHANHKVFGFMRVRSVLMAGLALYLCLVAYELTLLAIIQPIEQVYLG